MISRDQYKRLINPANIAKDMSLKEFEEWTLIGRGEVMYLQSLKDALKAFEKEEMFEHCIILKNRILEEENKNLTFNTGKKDKRSLSDKIETIFPYLPIMAVLLIILKLTNKIDLEWVFVLSPVWLPGIALTVFYSIVFGKIKK